MKEQQWWNVTKLVHAINLSLVMPKLGRVVKCQSSLSNLFKITGSKMQHNLTNRRFLFLFEHF